MIKIPTINKPTRVTKKNATAINHIITNSCFVENTFKTAIIKTYVPDHLPICFFFPSTNLFTKNNVIYQYKRTINDKRKLKLFFKNSINMTRIPLKPIRMLMKLTIVSYRHFIQFMTHFFL